MARRAEESKQHYFSAALLMLAAEAETPREDEGGLTPRLDRDAANCFFSAGAFALAGNMFAIAAAASRCQTLPPPPLWTHSTSGCYSPSLVLTLPGTRAGTTRSA